MQTTGKTVKLTGFGPTFFSYKDLVEILAEKDFNQIKFHENILPGSELYNGQDVTFCTAIKNI